MILTHGMERDGQIRWWCSGTYGSLPRDDSSQPQPWKLYHQPAREPANFNLPSYSMVRTFSESILRTPPVGLALLRVLCNLLGTMGTARSAAGPVWLFQVHGQLAPYKIRAFQVVLFGWLTRWAGVEALNWPTS